jgi:hypothetical protein
MPLAITDQFLKPESFMPERHPKKQIFIHHTAGSHNPVNVIHGWDVDTRGRVATAFIIGGRSSKGTDDSFNGKVYRTFDENCWAYHLGLDKSALDKSSIGIEICNFGYLRKAANKYLTYIASEMSPAQVSTLTSPFRNYVYYHTYSRQQLDSLRELLLQLSATFNIDLKKGLQEWIRKEGLKMPATARTTKQKQQWLRDNGFVGKDGKLIAADGVMGENTRYAIASIGRNAFDLNTACLRGAPGLWTHTNVRPDKFDCFPQQELRELILSF